jgi:hypothetical protein
MLKGLLTRVFGRTGHVHTQPHEGAPVMALSAENPPAGDTARGSAKPPSNGEPEAIRESGILSNCKAVVSAGNLLAIREVRRTGPVAWIPELNGWRINPSTTFPLTVVGSDERTARRIREVLDGMVDHHQEDVAEAIAGAVVERGARFHEFEEYLTRQRRLYQEALAAARASVKPGQQNDEEIDSHAAEALDRCRDDLSVLLNGDYPSGAVAHSVICRLGYANLLRYVAMGPGTAKLVAPGHRRRPSFESLVRSGLAIGEDKIAEIPARALLHTQTVKELQQISARPIPSTSRKQELAVEFLLGQEGIRERALATIRAGEVFYMLPLSEELRALDLRRLHEEMAFALDAVALVVETYLTAALAPTNTEYEGRHLGTERFQAHNISDISTCRYCRKMSGTSRRLADWDHFPFHFGCRCSLLIDSL